MPVIRALIAIGAALALADASVVTLALPPMLDDLDTTVEGVAAVIGVYTLVLAALLPAALRLRRWIPDAALGAGGFAVFALAGALCSLPDDLAAMLAFRALQAAGAAAALAAAFDWRAIFLAQVPLGLAAAAAAAVMARGGERAAAAAGRPVPVAARG